jgi:hypothetical protein
MDDFEDLSCEVHASAISNIVIAMSTSVLDQVQQACEYNFDVSEHLTFHSIQYNSQV